VSKNFVLVGEEQRKDEDSSCNGQANELIQKQRP